MQRQSTKNEAIVFAFVKLMEKGFILLLKLKQLFSRKQ